MATIVVMGVSGCGKSTVGQAIAQALGVEFADGDDFHPISNKQKMAAGTPLTDDDRWPWLAIVAEWLASPPDGGVIACSALKRSYRDALRQGAPGTFFVHLHGPKQEALRRVQSRPDHFMPASLVDSQYETLELLGEDEEGVQLDFRDSVDDLVEQTRQALARRTSGAR